MTASARLLPQHAGLLTASAISDEVAMARGYRSVTTKAELKRLGFADLQARVPALLIPIRGVTGEIVTYQTRADVPRVVDGKAVKYEIPKGSPMVLDVPPSCRKDIGNPGIPLLVTEGIRKADAAASVDLCCVALLGVWTWRGTNDFGGKTALADWESIALNDRIVYIGFDSDVMTKIAVYRALVRLKAFLERRGAQVRLIYLPPGPGGAKVGLDDYLADNHAVDDLLALATTELRPAPGDDESRDVPYRETPAGLVYDKPTANGPIPVPLTNFGARIVSELVEDDGAEQRRLFEIEANVAGRISRCEVPAASFMMMTWPAENLGANAVIYAGMSVRDHARAAVQLLSGDVPVRFVYTHTGWGQIEGTSVYLHAGGAIGPQGAVDGVESRLDGPLANFRLPDPPAGDERRDAVRASLRLLDVAPDRITVPLLAATYRAALGPADFGMHISGPTGVFKTELASLAQQHFGAAMDSRHVPGAWSSTGNSIEALAFAAKDALLLVDDFAPSGSTADVQRLHGTADRVLRAQGNRSGRGRMRADTTLRPPKPPRGLLLSTGEEIPRGQSLQARLLTLEVSPDDVDGQVLGACQAEAAAGRYSEAMASFISSIAARYDELQADLQTEIVWRRQEAHGSHAHRRSPEIVANLTFAMEQFLIFAQEIGAIGPSEHVALSKRCAVALDHAADYQAQHQVASDPATRFLELVAAALVSGGAHVASPDGGPPPDPGVWGWRWRDWGERGTWDPHGLRIGWIAEDDAGPALFLDPDASFAAAQAMGRATGDLLSVGPKTLHRRLDQAGLLLSTEAGRDRLTVRRMLDGARRTVLHLAPSVLEGTAPTTDHGPEHGDVGPVRWATRGPARPQTAHARVASPARPERGHATPGTVGTVGTVPADTETRAGATDESRPNSVSSEAELIELVRQRLASGDLRSPTQLTSGVRVVDPALAASRWFKDLENAGWIGDVARVQLLRLGRALLGAATDA